MLADDSVHLPTVELLSDLPAPPPDDFVCVLIIAGAGIGEVVGHYLTVEEQAIACH